VSEKKKILINSNASETRVALVENGRVAEIFIERVGERGLVGNIYKGKVSRVLPGMQSAFIDIGMDRAAFLFGGDVIDPKEAAKAKSGDGNEVEDADEVLTKRRSGSKLPIEKLLRQGQEVIVQVAKDPIGTKGPRVTTYLSLAGRYLVVLPDTHSIGISRRIEQEKDRQRLRKIADKIKGQGAGLIIRTAAAEATEKQLQDDLNHLLTAWKTIKTKKAKQKAPSIIFGEQALHLKIIRDLYNDEVSEIIVDDKEVYKDLKAFLKANIPSASSKVLLYNKPNPLFDEHEIEFDIARALSSKVWLPSGGYLIIEQTEALTSLDVNTGKFVGKLSVQETILKTNLEAVPVIAAQLRLRNIGGIIVIDFIDMDSQADRDKVYTALEKALKNDKAKFNVLKINELGVVQMTRKRTSESLGRRLTEHCGHCDGRGHVRSVQTQVLDMIRDIDRICVKTKAKRLQIHIRKDLKDWLTNSEKTVFDEICKKNKVKVEFLRTNLRPEDLREPAYEILTQ
jgi:ribonuclease G